MINFPKLNIFNRKQNNQSAPRFCNFSFTGANLAPLKQDTITFTGSRYITRHRQNEVYAREMDQTVLDKLDESSVKRETKKLDQSDRPNSIVAQSVYEDTKFAYSRFKNDIQNIFGMPVLDANSDNFKNEYERVVRENDEKNAPILAITARQKSPESIAEKMGAKKITSKKLAKSEITDLVGIRILVSKPNKTSGDYIMEKLTEAVKKDWIKIVEVESFRNPELPGNRYAYVNQSRMDKLDKAIMSKGVKNYKSVQKSTESGYTAIHMLVELPGNIKGELQIMGPDVLRLKELEDLSYKVLTGKNIPKKYENIERMFKTLSGDKKLYAEFMDYTRQAYALERKRDSHPVFEEPEFLRLPKNTHLRPSYDFNNLLKIKQSADARARMEASRKADGN